MHDFYYILLPNSVAALQYLLNFFKIESQKHGGAMYPNRSAVIDAVLEELRNKRRNNRIERPPYAVSFQELGFTVLRMEDKKFALGLRVN